MFTQDCCIFITSLIRFLDASYCCFCIFNQVLQQHTIECFSAVDQMSTLDEMSVNSDESAIDESASASASTSGPSAVPALEVEPSAVAASDKPEADFPEQCVGSALAGAASLLVGASSQQCLTPTPRRRVLPVSPPASSDGDGVAAAPSTSPSPSPSPASVEEPASPAPAAADALAHEPEQDQSPPADALSTEPQPMLSAVADAEPDVAAPTHTQTADETAQRAGDSADTQQTQESRAALAPEPLVSASRANLFLIRAALLGAYRGMSSRSNLLLVACLVAFSICNSSILCTLYIYITYSYIRVRGQNSTLLD